MRKINEGNINVTLSLETMRANLTLHEHRVTDWIHPDALDDHDHDDKGFPVELDEEEGGEEGEEGEEGEGEEGVHKHKHVKVKAHQDGSDGSELEALLKELEDGAARDLQKSIKLAGAGQGRPLLPFPAQRHPVCH